MKRFGIFCLNLAKNLLDLPDFCQRFCGHFTDSLNFLGIFCARKISLLASVHSYSRNENCEFGENEFDRNLTKNTSQRRSNAASWAFSGNDFLTGLPDLQFCNLCRLFTISDVSCKFFLRKYYVFMEFYLSHTTALQLFRAMRIKGHGLIYHDSSSTGIHTEFLTLELGQIKEKVFSSLGIMLTEPIELVVDEKKNTYQSSRIKISHFVSFCANSVYGVESWYISD